ncbi:Integrator complex subunit 2 [Mortierella sp. AD094]|nr:Integrator complex subunit 2 [Mortierella sp. AD094]
MSSRTIPNASLSWSRDTRLTRCLFYSGIHRQVANAHSSTRAESSIALTSHSSDANRSQFDLLLLSLIQTLTASKYRDLDYRLIQRQVKEELQLEKQNVGTSTPASRTRLFETGTNEDRARSLRSLQDPAPTIAYIIANNPTEFSTTIESLLDTKEHYHNSKAILLRLCKLADHKIWGVRQQLIERKVFPNLAIELTIEHCHDEICFMNRILRGQPEWLTNGIDPVTKTSLTSIMEFVFSSLNDELTSEQPDNIAVNRLLRILSGMIGLMNLSLNAEQLEISLGVLEMTPLIPSTVDVKICLILMSAAQLLKYSQPRVERILHQMVRCQDSPQVLSLLIFFQQQQLLKIDDLASRSLSMSIVIPRGGLMELSALFSSLFSSVELSQCALNIGRPKSLELEPKSLTATSKSSPELPHQFSQEDSELRSTANLIAGHLLQQDIFHKSSIDVQRWVMEQIQASTVPLDANMIHLLRAYTSAIARSNHITRIPEREIRASFSNPSEDPTPAKVLLVLYMLMNNDVCVANLGSSNMERVREYNATLLEYVQVRKVALYVQNFQDGVAFRAVQPMFLKLVNAQFPELFDVTTLLLEESISTSSSTKALPGLTMGSTGMVATNTDTNLPSMASKDPVAFMEPHFHSIRQHLNSPDSAVKGKYMEQIYNSVHCVHCYHAFQRLSQVDRQSMARNIVQASLPSLLDPRSSPAVMEAFKNTWDRLNSIMPHELWALTIQALLPQPSSNTLPGPALPNSAVRNGSQTISKEPEERQQQEQQRSQKPQQDYYTFEWLVQDPLLLFKVDFRVFRSPMIFRLFIQILGAVMVGSRHWFRKQFHASQAIPLAPQNRNPAQVQRRQFKEVNLSTMLYIQDSTLIQLMLEACEARPEDLSLSTKPIKQGKNSKQGKSAKGDKGPPTEISEALQEVRVVTFNFLHQLFIDHKIFPKLVHFQGYAMDLLPATVAGIDSIHVCLDFLQELLFANAPASMLASSSVASSTGAGVGAGGPGEVRVDLAPQVFALRLAAHLCARFPLRNTLQMAEEVILPRLQALAISTGFSKVVLESAVILVKAFPSLRSEIIRILRETSGPQDKIALQRTIDAIVSELQDPVALDKSLLHQGKVAGAVAGVAGSVSGSGSAESGVSGLASSLWDVSGVGAAEEKITESGAVGVNISGSAGAGGK